MTKIYKSKSLANPEKALAARKRREEVLKVRKGESIADYEKHIDKAEALELEARANKDG